MSRYYFFGSRFADGITGSNKESYTFISYREFYNCMITKSGERSRRKEHASCVTEEKRKNSLANALSIKQHLLERRGRAAVEGGGGGTDESHGQKVITAMGCHAKMFHQSCECRELSEFSDGSTPLSWIPLRARRMKLSFRYRSGLNELRIFSVSFTC